MNPNPTKVTLNEKANTVDLESTCWLCKEPSTVTMPMEAYTRWQEGAFIQRAWPDGSAADREIAMSGAHGKCYDDAFKDDDSMEGTGEQTVRD